MQRGGRRTLPYVFTEHGVVMLASVLNSLQAIEASIQVVKMFIKLRSILSSHVHLAEKLKELENKYDSQFDEVFSLLRKIMNVPKVQVNKGKVIIKYINYYIDLPESFIDLKELKYLPKREEGIRQFYSENTTRDVMGITGVHSDYVTQYDPSRFDPILPGTRGKSEDINLIEDPVLDEREITWIAYADEAEPKKEKIKLKDILVITKDEPKK